MTEEMFNKWWHKHYEPADIQIDDLIKGGKNIRMSASVYKDGIKQAYLAGLHEGRPKWHDLRKDPNDLPKKNNGIYLVAWKRDKYIEEYGEYGYDTDLFNADEGYFEGTGDYAIAWCEIPTFKE